MFRNTKSSFEKHTGRWSSPKGSFKNYVDKMRGVGGSSLNTFMVKNVHTKVGRLSKKIKICPRSYRMAQTFGLCMRFYARAPSLFFSPPSQALC